MTNDRWEHPNVRIERQKTQTAQAARARKAARRDAHCRVRLAVADARFDALFNHLDTSRNDDGRKWRFVTNNVTLNGHGGRDTFLSVSDLRTTRQT